MNKNHILALSAAACLVAGCASNTGDKASTAPQERIKADQIGYQTHSTKIAIIPDGTADEVTWLPLPL